MKYTVEEQTHLEPQSSHFQQNKKSTDDFGKITSIKTPKKRELYTIRGLVAAGMLAMGVFVWWFVRYVDVGYAPLYWMLTIVMVFKLLRMLHEWIHYAGISVPQKPKLKKKFKVDMLTTFCPGEPYEMILTTLKAMKAVRYPHTTYLCDEANDPYLKKECERLGVVHVTREKKVNAKAGNINNALKQAKGDICVVLDPDHVPRPEFIDNVLPYFQDDKIGFVQVVQAYHNHKDSFVAMGAAEQTYSFYGPMMMSMNSYGTVQAIGANCTFRREALDSIGGHAAGLSEDMHTAMQMHAKGWKSVYVPEILAKGLVPSTLAGYYSQQLKWSRGTFELWVTSYIKLFKQFTWQQKLHYFTIPLYFLFGALALFDIIVPVVALITGRTPWKLDIAAFTVMFMPMFALSLLIRQYAQRWLLEEHERGFHIIGGLLRMGTWWIFTLGFIYTIFRKKVPYIPTPKDDKPRNNVLLSMPNVAACLISLAAIAYGLSLDWSPYSFMMAGFAMVNVCILGFVVVMGQEKLLLYIYDWITSDAPFKSYVMPSRIIWWKIRHGFYATMRNGALMFAMAFFVFLFGFMFLDNRNHAYLSEMAPPEMKSTGGFYTGIYMPDVDKTLSASPVKPVSAAMNKNFDIISFYQAWGPESLAEFPEGMMKEVTANGGIPMITWEPWATTFPEHLSDPELGADRKICIAIYDGRFDDYIRAYARKIRAFGDPVFLRFAHEPDNPHYPWSESGGNTPGEYIGAWQHTVEIFQEEGVYNVSWVWNPWRHENVYTYFPGGKYVDWIGITALNYGEASLDGRWRSFDEVYLPYREQIKSLKRPVMLAEFGSTSYGGNQHEWIEDALDRISTEYKEIQAAVFFYSDRDKNWATDWRPSANAQFIDWTFKSEQTLESAKTALAKHPYNKRPLEAEGSDKEGFFLPKDTLYTSKHYAGTPKDWKLLVNGEPFYIQGVAYNSAHDWRDGNMPLTRHQVRTDFEAIKDMGANSVRRYAPGAFDVNILRTAEEFDIKVMYGFWFDPQVDYYRDTIRLHEYIREVETTVRRYKDNKSIMAWSVGNETWGLLKHTYSKPYLIKVRQQYVRFLEHLAQRIHEIDPDRPVFTGIEHERYQLASELASYRDEAPSLDLLGINSYYTEQISQLHDVMYKVDSMRPYFISEFGPKGYWDDELSDFESDTILIEQSNYEKSMMYLAEWRKNVVFHAGRNVGGVAFSWRDRLEGTSTWFGLTDFKGRLKPSYYALRREWTGQEPEIHLHDAFITHYDKALNPGETYDFHAISENNLSHSLVYEWYLCREEFLDYVKIDKVTAGGRKATITIPQDPSSYRLYLFIADPDGKSVVTASEPLRVQWPDEPVSRSLIRRQFKFYLKPPEKTSGMIVFRKY
jgi:cellulose synthase (UDP-forming)